VAAVGFGFILIGYSVLFYGLALTTEQHMNLLYAAFHVGSKGNAQADTVKGQTTTVTPSQTGSGGSQSGSSGGSGGGGALVQ